MPKKQTTAPKQNLPAIAVAICLILYLWYTMPKSVEQLYPYLDLSECTGITVYYEDSAPADFTEVKLTAQEAAPIVELLEGRTFRRTLGSIIPPNGRYHNPEPGDFTWELFFYFEDVTLPDGSGASGVLLHINNFYGKLDISSDGKTRYNLSTAGKDAWLQEIMDAVYAAETP